MSNLSGIIMNTKGGGSIALLSCNDREYIKEAYSEADAQGELRKSKRVKLPVSRNGHTFETVLSLFNSLVREEEYLPLA